MEQCADMKDCKDDASCWVDSTYVDTNGDTVNIRVCRMVEGSGCDSTACVKAGCDMPGKCDPSTCDKPCCSAGKKCAMKMGACDEEACKKAGCKTPGKCDPAKCDMPCCKKQEAKKCCKKK
jgi:hypothetical protein